MIWDQNAQKTRPTLLVSMDGKITRYEVGQLGLTRNIIMGSHADKAEWAEKALGRALTPVAHITDR